MSSFTQTPRTSMTRRAGRASYDKDVIYPILDEGLTCSVGYSTKAGPHVTPMIYGRKDDRLYLHGSGAAGLFGTLADGVETCVNVTLTDGIVVASSGYYHSIRYRSVTLFGSATKVPEGEKLLESLRVITEHTIPGRWKDLPTPTDWEIGEVTVLSIPLEEVSAKVMSEDAADVDEKPGLWAGVIPLALEAKAPVDHPDLGSGIEPPDYIKNYQRPKA